MQYLALAGAALVVLEVWCVALEGPMFLLHLWALPGAPAEFALFGDAHRFAWAEYLTTTLVFGLIGCCVTSATTRGARWSSATWAPLARPAHLHQRVRPRRCRRGRSSRP